MLFVEKNKPLFYACKWKNEFMYMLQEIDAYQV